LPNALQHRLQWFVKLPIGDAPIGPDKSASTKKNVHLQHVANLKKKTLE
jgi:hypothetical protein